MTLTTKTSSSGIVWTSKELSGNPHEVSDKAERVQRMFAAIAQSYDLNNRLHSLGRDQAWRRAAVKLANLKPDEEVLDCACGTGDLSLAFLKAGSKRVVGVDFTEPMLELAVKKARALVNEKDQPRISFEYGDITDLQFENESFDVVSIAFGIRNVNEPAVALKEFRRVLRQGGRLVILEFSHPGNPLLRAMNNLYCNWIMPITASIIAGDRSGAYKYLPKSISTFREGEGMAADMRDAGFTQVAIHPQMFGVCTIYVATFD